MSKESNFALMRESILLDNLEIIPEFSMTRDIFNDIFEQVHAGKG
jgi:hypothetical protein